MGLGLGLGLGLALAVVNLGFLLKRRENWLPSEFWRCSPS